MNEEEYNIGYYLDMIKVMEKTEGLIEEHSLIESEKLKWSIMELIAIYYSKPFLGSNRAYRREDGTRHRPHRITPEEINFTEEERRVHDLAFDWRNGYIAHSDQEKRDQELELKRNEHGRIIGFHGTSSSGIMPLFVFQFETIRSNISKIKGILWTKIYA